MLFWLVNNQTTKFNAPKYRNVLLDVSLELSK